MDFGVPNSGLTGIVVDSNGELRFLQTTNHAKSIMVTGNGVNGGVGTNVAMLGNGGVTHRKAESDSNKVRVGGKGCAGNVVPHNSYQSRSHRPKLQVALDGVKDECDDDVFLSPTRYVHRLQIVSYCKEFQ